MRSSHLGLIAKLLGAAGLLASVMAAPLRAGGLIDEIRFGVLGHDTPKLWSGFQLEKGGIDINGELQFRPVLSLFGGHVRPVIGGTYHTGGGTSRGYIDARWQLDIGSRFFIAAGIGAGIHNGKLDPTDVDRKALGSRVLFHIPAEIGLYLTPQQSISLYFEHYSNAGTRSANEGLDAVGIRYGQRF